MMCDIAIASDNAVFGQVCLRLDGSGPCSCILAEDLACSICMSDPVRFALMMPSQACIAALCGFACILICHVSILLTLDHLHKYLLPCLRADQRHWSVAAALTLKFSPQGQLKASLANGRAMTWTAR